MRALVTGGGTGIGRAVCEAIIADGGSVVAVGRRAEPLNALAAAHPGRVHALPCDVTTGKNLCRRAASLLGGLEVLVHSAGEVVHQAPGTISEAALRAQLEVNLVAPLRLGEEALEVLEKGGCMVFISSTLAVRPVVTSAVYSAAKAGLSPIIRVLALSGAARGVRANAVVPGIVDTEMIAGRDRAELVALHPLGRLGTPKDVAATVLHVLKASWMTGSEVVLDGGLLLRG